MQTLILIIFIFLSGSVSALQFKNEDVISVHKDGIQRVMLNIHPYISDIKKGDLVQTKENFIDFVDKYIKDSYFCDPSINKINLRIVIISNMDEYARPNFSEMSRVAEIVYFREQDKSIRKDILALNLNLLDSK